MDASRAPCPAPGMVMSRYHRIPGPCIPPELAGGKAPLRRHPFSSSRVSLSSYRSADPPVRFPPPPAPPPGIQSDTKFAVHGSHLKRVAVFTLSSRARTRTR